MKPLGAIAALCVAALGLVELGLHFHFARAAPDLEAWRALEPAVRKLWQPGTLIVVAPEWAEPNARHALGDALMPLAHVARADESRFARAIEIGILGQAAAPLEHWQVESVEPHAKFSLRLLSNPAPIIPSYDFLERLEPPFASVWISRQGRRDECRFGARAKVENGDLHGHPTYPRERFTCPGEGSWLFAGRTVIEDQHYRPRQCIWAHPPKRGELELSFSAVTLGAEIRGYGALPYWVERDGRGAPVHMTVRVDEETLGTFTHEDGEGWKPFAFETRRFAGNSKMVTFAVSAKRPAHRQFCFRAEVR